MKYTIALFALAAALVIVFPRGDREVDAQTSPTTYKPSISRHDAGYVYNDTLKRADAAGRLAFLVYWRSDMAGGAIRARNAVLKDNADRLRKHFILAGMLIERDNKQFPALSDKIGGGMAPYWFAVRPDGTFVAGGDLDTIGPEGDGAWSETVAELIEDYPPIPQKEWRAIGGTYKGAKKDYDAGRLERVDRAMGKLKDVWWPIELAGPCRELWETFSADMAERIDPADQMVLDGRYDDAVAAYEAVMADLSSRGALGKDIQRKLQLLNNEEYEALKAELTPDDEDDADDEEVDDEDYVGFETDDEDAETQDEDDVDNPWGEEDDADDEDDADGEDENLADDGADDTGDDADDADEDLDTDEAVSSDDEDDTEVVETPPPPRPEPEPLSDEDRAKGLVQLAKMYRDRGMTDRAVAKLETCLDKYPDTEAAKEAKGLLKAWQ